MAVLFLRVCRRVLLAVAGFAVMMLLLASPVSAHNSLVSSDPADGVAIGVTPGQLQLVFSAAVPLDSLSVEHIDASGVRSELTGFAHGPSGEAEVLVPLPPVAAGAVALRWRLVGPDGHAVTGRVNFVVEPAPAVTTADEPVTGTAVAAEAGPVVEFSSPWSAPAGSRWLLRYGSYLAIMFLGGVAATLAFVWRGAWFHAGVRKATRCAIGAAAVGGFAQLMIIASDVSGDPPWASWGSLAPAVRTDAGGAFVVRLILLAALVLIVSEVWALRERARLFAGSGVVVGLFATWAYAGHAKSMPLAWIGVPLDVVHQAAAATWIGGLVLVSVVAVRSVDPVELVEVVQRFARVAAISVATIVASGVAQSIRLTGQPTSLLDVGHSRYLLLKIVVMALMLKVADVNRRRVAARFQTVGTVTPLVTDNLRRAMMTEFCVGLVVIGLTAAMVVSPPAVAAHGDLLTPIASCRST